MQVQMHPVKKQFALDGGGMLDGHSIFGWLSFMSLSYWPIWSALGPGINIFQTGRARYRPRCHRTGPLNVTYVVLNSDCILAIVNQRTSSLGVAC